MIKGIQAFEACWMNLRASYPTGPAQNLMIAQAMGKVTDCYGTAEEIERTLPTDLQTLFRTLIHAYFNGYAVKSLPAEKSRLSAISDRNQPIKSTQKSQLSGGASRADASGKPTQPNKTAQHTRRNNQDFWGTNRNEADTLIIELPFLD